MEAADKGLQGGASFYLDHHLDAREGDPVGGTQGDLFQEPQHQPVDPHTAPATQGLEAEGPQSTAHLPVGLQGQVLARGGGAAAGGRPLGRTPQAAGLMSCYSRGGMVAKMAGPFVGWCRLTCRTVWSLSMDRSLRRMEHRPRGVVEPDTPLTP